MYSTGFREARAGTTVAEVTAPIGAGIAWFHEAPIMTAEQMLILVKLRMGACDASTAVAGSRMLGLTTVWRRNL